jgi:TRAP transporter TAXI family solute receptor
MPRFISIGTAPLGGTFYQVGAGISDALTAGKEAGGWRQSTAESTGGSLENFRRLDSEDIQIGMANSSITYFAVRGEGGFETKHDVKTIMTMFPLVAMFVTKEGTGVESIADLQGKRVCVGPEGAGFEYFIGPIVEAHGVKYDDFDPVYAGMQTSVGYLQDESVAATFLGGGLRSQAITSAASTMPIKLVPYGASERQGLIDKYPSFVPVVVPGGTYKGQEEPFDALNVGSAHLLVRSDANEEFVYRATGTIYEAREKLAETHAAAKAINPKNVIKHVGTDFHPGAIRYYKEIGIWPAGEEAEETATDASPAEPAASEAAPAEKTAAEASPEKE